jgi:hypothetical protein
MPTPNTIREVVIRQILDDSPDLSHLGEYHSDYREGCIDRKERGDMDRNEYRYFTPAMTGEETGNPESPEQDYLRMENYNRGDWHMLGIRAEARVVVKDTVQTITSCGLWGVESDSEDDYLKEVGQEELSGLREILLSLGFTEAEIDAAFKEVKTVDH